MALSRRAFIDGLPGIVAGGSGFAAAATQLGGLAGSAVLTERQLHWIETATAHLRQIYQGREFGRSNDCAFCIFEIGTAYVQYLAPFDASHLLFEAVSEISVADVGFILTPEKASLLQALGFDAPGRSPNYAQTIPISGPDDLARAALLGFRVLSEVFDASDFHLTVWKVRIPAVLKGGVGQS